MRFEFRNAAANAVIEDIVESDDPVDLTFYFFSLNIMSAINVGIEVSGVDAADFPPSASPSTVVAVAATGTGLSFINLLDSDNTEDCETLRVTLQPSASNEYRLPAQRIHDLIIRDPDILTVADCP